MRRYEIWKNADGTVTVEEHPRGDWMRSTEVDAAINRMEAGLLSMIQSELSEAEPDPMAREWMQMGMAEIRRWRGVPAKRGMRIYSRHSERFGTIVSTNGGYLKIRLDGDDHAGCYHPTWKLDYLAKDGTVLKSCGD